MLSDKEKRSKRRKNKQKIDNKQEFNRKEEVSDKYIKGKYKIDWEKEIEEEYGTSKQVPQKQLHKYK